MNEKQLEKIKKEVQKIIEENKGRIKKVAGKELLDKFLLDISHQPVLTDKNERPDSEEELQNSSRGPRQEFHCALKHLSNAEEHIHESINNAVRTSNKSLAVRLSGLLGDVLKSRDDLDDLMGEYMYKMALKKASEVMYYDLRDKTDMSEVNKSLLKTIDKLDKANLQGCTRCGKEGR